jgi:branched-chain amino acid transport system ATP-binding protein
VLEIQGVTKRFGGLVAINNLTMRVEPKQFLGVIGPNGAGKTTLLNLITGYQKPTAGRIFFQGERIDGKKPYQLCHLGIARTFQIVQPFPEMSVLDNAMTGALFSKGGGSIAKARDRAMEALELVDLAKQADLMAGALTLGNKKKLELARALATKPQLLLLDEVMAGSTQGDIAELMGLLKRIHASGVTILMIEHLVHVILELSEHVFVLNFGQELYQGKPLDVVAHPEVIESYIGKPLGTARGRAAV